MLKYVKRIAQVLTATKWWNQELNFALCISQDCDSKGMARWNGIIWGEFNVGRV